MKNPFLGNCFSADFWHKTLRVNKIAMKSFSEKNLSFEIDLHFKLKVPSLTYKN